MIQTTLELFNNIWMAVIITDLVGILPFLHTTVELLHFYKYISHSQVIYWRYSDIAHCLGTFQDSFLPGQVQKLPI